MNFIRRRPKNRPYAADSTGRRRGTLRTRIGQISVFEAKGSAREKFADEISGAIVQYLRDNSEELQDSTSYIGLSLFMMGKSAEKTKPVVMLVSDDKSARVEAFRLIRDSGIMKNYPGFDLGEMELKAEFENLQSLGSECINDMSIYPVFDSAPTELSAELEYPPAPAHQPSSMGARLDRRSPESYAPPENPIQVFGKLDGPFQDWRLEVEIGKGSATRRSFASAGGGVSYKGESMVHSVSHFLWSAQPNREKRASAIDSAARSSASDVECEIMDLSDFEDDSEDDDMADITSRGSVSPAVSDVETASGASSPSGSEWSFPPNSPSYESLEALPSPASAFNSQLDALVGETSQPVAEPAFSTTAGEVILTSNRLDSAFIRVNSPTPTGFCMPLESYKDHVEMAPSDVAITTMTRRGLVKGTLSGTPFFVRLPRAKEFQEVYTAKFDCPMLPGDCGCWVKGEISEKIFGHVIAGSMTSGLVLLMPAARVFAQLLEDLTAKDTEAEARAKEAARSTTAPYRFHEYDLAPSATAFDTPSTSYHALSRYLSDSSHTSFSHFSLAIQHRLGMDADDGTSLNQQLIKESSWLHQDLSGASFTSLPMPPLESFNGDTFAYSSVPPVEDAMYTSPPVPLDEKDAEIDVPDCNIDAPLPWSPKRKANIAADDDDDYIPSKKLRRPEAKPKTFRRRRRSEARAMRESEHPSSERLRQRSMVSGTANLHCLEPSCANAKHSFADQASLDTHMKQKHTRPFICVFHFAGCASTFASKNEWKRHVSSQHLLLDYWLCDNGPCGEPRRNAASPIHSSASKSRESSPASDNDTGGKSNTSHGVIFNRKDLFMQHVRRMHMPDSKEKKVLGEWQDKLQRYEKHARRERCKLPESMSCPVIGCPTVFRGPDAWDQRMEHVARHMERAAQGREEEVVFGGDADRCLVEWAARVDVGIIIRVPGDGGGWALKGRPWTGKTRLKEDRKGEEGIEEGDGELPCLYTEKSPKKSRVFSPVSHGFFLAESLD